MRKLIMILVMAMVAFGSFAKDFEYKDSGDSAWRYCDKQRTLCHERKGWGTDYITLTYDVSEEDAWDIILGLEFPTFEFFRYTTGTQVTVQRIAARDYSKMGN